MKSPQRVARMADGFNATARDLDRALLVALFSSLEMLLIGHARELSWSRAREVGAEATPFRLNLSALADVARVRRTSLSPLFRDLVSMRVFTKLEDGSFLINKDFREWLNKDGTPRLDSGQVEWCMAAMRPKRSGRKAREDTMHLSEKSDTPLSEKSDSLDDAPVGIFRHPLSEKSDTPCLKNQTVRTSPPTTPNKERTSEEFKKNEEEGERARSGFPSSPQRPPDDLADIRKAEAILASNLQTHHIAMELGRCHLLNGLVALPGWKFVRAAERLTSGEYGADKQTWHYFLGIAKRLTDAERNGPTKPAGKPSEPQPGYLREDFGPAWWYRRRGLPLPAGHPDLIAETLRNGSGLPHNASPEDFGGRDPLGA